MAPHTYEGILLLLFPASDSDWNTRRLIQEGDQVRLPLAARRPSPLLSTPIGRDSHHMEVMGGMAALISERLPADKANGCGEA